MAVLKEMRAADDHKRRRAATEKRRAAIEKERSLICSILLAKPSTTREIAQELNLTPEMVRLRVHQVGGVKDNIGRWQLAENR
ncbi:hypothetical protein A7K50_12365 [Dehalobacter sp. MCB1]|nr:hypothetical protein A7K50_12365 [Dehalobacter sp. MCB1]